MKIATRIPRVGDTVRVVPTSPILVGRGIGIVEHAGDTLVRVRFLQTHPERAIACLLRDCTVLEVRA